VPYMAITTVFVFELEESCRTRGHSLKLKKRRISTDLRQHFSPWNALDDDLVYSSSLNVFKNGLHLLWKNKKHLKNVGPIRHCEPPHAHSPGVATGTVARRLRIDVHDDNDDNDNDNA